jgi:DNA/RNA endonuclease YhcR with UshA esterase domain
MSLLRRAWTAQLTVALLMGFAGLALANELPVIKPEDAGDHIDKECIVEFEVKAGRVIQDKNVGFLNSNRDHREEGTFTVFFGKKGLQAFKDQRKIENPAAEFVGKTIRVKGKVALHKGKLEIEVEDPDQIELVKADEPTQESPK